MADYETLEDPAAIIATRRQDLMLSQAELGAKLGFGNVNFISMVETGRSRVPLERAEEFARALEMDVRWFVIRVLAERFPSVVEVILGTKEFSASLT